MMLMLGARMDCQGATPDPGTSVIFDGVTGQMGTTVSVPALNSYPLTVSFWLKTSTIDGNARGLVSKYADGSLNGWSMHLLNGRLRGWYFGSASRYVWDGGQGMDGGLVADGKWHHLAMTIDSSGGKLFVDGSLTTFRSWFGVPLASTSSAPLQIGRYHNYPNSLVGEIDEVSVWSVSKIPADLRRAPLAGNESGLQAYWKCNDAAGALLEDSSSNNRDVTLLGAPSFVGSGVLFGSHVPVSIPGIGDQGGQDIVASDPPRAGVNSGASLNFFRPSNGPAETLNFEAALRLIDITGNPIPLSGGETEVTIAVPVTFGAGAVAFQSKFPAAILTPATALDPAALVRVEAIVRREDPCAPGSFVEQARRSNDGFQYWHFTSTDSADLADNVLGRLDNVTIPRRVVIGSRLQVDIAATLRRFDAFAEAMADDKTFDVTFTPRLIDVTDGNTVLPLTGGETTLPVTLATYVEGMPRVPSTATPSPTLLLETTAEFPPTHDYRVEVDMSWTEAGGITRTVTAGSQVWPLAVFSGKLFFGGIETTFTALGGAPIDLGGGQFRLPVSAAFVTGFPTHTFVGNPIVTIDPLTRDATVVSANILVNGPALDNDTVSNVHFRRGAVTLTQTGASAGITVRLPAGFGVAWAAGSRRMRGEWELVVALGQSLAPSLASVILTNPIISGNALFPSVERLPQRFRTSEIRWLVGEGAFEFTPDSSEYVREVELATIEATAALLRDPAASQRFSNEGYHRTASARPGEIVRVTANASGVALADVKLDIEANRGFTAHFPQGLATSWTAPGSLEIVSGAIDATVSSLEGVGGTILSYAQGCPAPPGCAPMAVNPLETVGFSPNGARWNFTADGGLRAEGATAVTGAPVDLKWGAKPVSGATEFTHRAEGFVNGAALVAGHVLAGGTVPAGVSDGEKPCALLFSGFGSPSDPARVERPQDGSYAEGFADYAGINFRVGTDGAFNGRSFIGDKVFGPYGIKGLSKYYIRRSGMSGIHDAITADVLPAPQVYGYQLTLDGLRLSYLDSANIESATVGSIFLPNPSLIDVAFSRLLLTCQGDLKTADLSNPGTRTLAYWGISIMPKTMEFNGGKDAHGCPTSGPKFLTLGVIGSMPAITTDPLYAALGIRSNGRLVTAGDDDAKGSGLDSRFTMPNTIRVKGDNGGSYPMTIATKAALNDFANGQAEAPVGFVSFAGSLNVPFFEDIKVHVHANPAGSANSLVYLMGGWPTDAKAPSGFGWNVSGKDYFNDLNFDAANRGFPAGVSLATYRNNPDTSNPLYHPRARKLWPGVVTMEYALAWNPGRRSFRGFKGDNDTLLVIGVEHQVQDLTSKGCSITFGTEFATPRLNVSDLVAGQLNLGSGIASALNGVVDVNSLIGGVENLDRFVTDRVSRLLDAPVDQALDPVADQLILALTSGYAASGNNFNFCANPAALNGNLPQLSNQLQSLLASGGPLLNELDATLASAIAGCDTALTLIGSNGARGKIVSAVNQLAAIGGTNIGDLSTFIGDADAALAEARRVVLEVRATLVETRASLQSGGPILAELNKSINDSVAAAGPKALNAVCQYFLLERNPNAAFFEEHPNAKLKPIIKRILKDALFGDVLAQRLQSVFRVRFADLRGRFRAGLDLAMSEINRVLNKAAGDATGEVFSALADAGGGGGVGDFMAAAKIDGYAQIDGEEIEEVRINAKLKMSVPDEFKIDAFIRILNTDSDTPNTSCRPPGAVKTEVTVGAHGKGVFGVIPVEASIDGKFSFDSSAALTGLDGGLDLRTKLLIKQVSMERAALKFGFGGGEGYISARVAGKVDFVSAEVFAFFGATRNPQAFDLIDRDTKKLLTAPGLDARGCFASPLIGFYLGAEATVSINEFFRIPDTCLLSLHGIVGSGSFAFVQNGNLTTGYRTLIGIDGELLCIVHVHGEIGYAISTTIPIPLPGENFIGKFNELSLSGLGRLSVSAEIGICPFCVDFSKDFNVIARISPGDGVSVEFE